MDAVYPTPTDGQTDYSLTHTNVLVRSTTPRRSEKIALIRFCAWITTLATEINRRENCYEEVVLPHHRFHSVGVLIGPVKDHLRGEGAGVQLLSQVEPIQLRREEGREKE